MSSADVARLPRDRTTRRYAAVLTWCEWLLAMASPSMSSGASHAPGLLFDMNKLFEAHVAGLEELDAGSDRIVYRQGPQAPLAMRGGDGVFLLKPDITVWQLDQQGTGSKIERVVDAKWKRLDPRAADLALMRRMCTRSSPTRCATVVTRSRWPTLCPVALSQLFRCRPSSVLTLAMVRETSRSS